MKLQIASLISASMLVLCANLSAVDKQRRPTCPTIGVECPNEVEKGRMMWCSVSVAGLDDPSGLKFTWSVSRGGIITRGKKSASVLIDPTGGFPGTMVATVEVDGLPVASCPKTASSYSILYVKESASKIIAEYGDVRFAVERDYLDLLAQRLRDEPGSRPHIIAYAGRYAYENEASERAGQAKRYLVEKHRIESERIVTVDGGFREVRTVELWIEEPGALNEPLATPTLKREEVQIIKRKRAQE